MFDDLKQGGTPSAPQNNMPPMTPASPGPMPDMFADTDPVAERPSAVQSGKIRPVSQTTSVPASSPTLQVNAMGNSANMGANNMLREDMMVAERGGSKVKKIVLIVIGMFLALGVAVSAYVFIFNKPQNANTDVNNEISNEVNDENSVTNENTNNANGNEVVNEQVVDNPDLLDDDKDGLTNGEEKLLGTDPLLADTDNDRLFDFDEVRVYHSDPISNDTDKDALLDYDEVMTWFTNPLIPDTDADGYSDGVEVNNKFNPLGSGTISDWKPPVGNSLPVDNSLPSGASTPGANPAPTGSAN